MEIDKILGELPSEFNNPFRSKYVNKINISMNTVLGELCFYGSVYFRNGNTEGSQHFDGNNLVEVFIKVRNFCLSLENGETTSD